MYRSVPLRSRLLVTLLPRVACAAPNAIAVETSDHMRSTDRWDTEIIPVKPHLFQRWRQLFRLRRNRRQQVIYVSHGIIPTLLLIISFVPPQQCVAVIHSVLHVDLKNSYGTVIGSLSFLAYLMAIRRFGTVVAVSDVVRRHLIAHGLRAGKVVRIWNGVDAALDQPQQILEKKQPRVSGTSLVLMFAGGLNPNKGVHLLPEVIAILTRDSSATVELHIAGSGPLMPWLRKHLPLDQARCELHGFLPRGKVLSLMRRSDYLLHLSKTEGFGIVGVEAVLSGCIPIVTKTPTTREIWGDLLAVIGTDWSARSIVTTLTALETMDLRKIRQRLRRRVLENFTHEVMFREYRRLFERLTGAQ